MDCRYLFSKLSTAILKHNRIMNDKTKKYLDKIIKFMVDDTIINHEEKRIIFPFSYSPLFFSSFFFVLLPTYFPTFAKYCKDTYGLTEEEIEYVWEEYT